MGTPAVGDVGERLRRSRTKRDFAVTSEPTGTAPPPSDGHRFVVQRHRARRLHYDLRLEAAGVLLSWAVPKGPTLDADVRRMAVHVEDHPLDYFDFEGVIPAGEYGGGDVVVWDWGTWSLAAGDDALAAVDAGDLHFDLAGEKLHGRFVLVRRGRQRGGGNGNEWLLIKKADDGAVAGWDPEGHLRSVKSGRTNEEVAAAPAASWSSAATWAAPTSDELAALDGMGTSGRWRLGEHTLRLTNLDKVVFPARSASTAVTKRDLIRHNATMGPVMLPYLAGRSVDMYRSPNGVDGLRIWHKAAGRAPEWLGRWRDEEAAAGAMTGHVLIDTPAALAWAANSGVVELHPWTSAIGAITQPTWAVIDIDSHPEGTFDDMVVLARLHRIALDHLHVRSALQLNGIRGLQIWIPVAAGHSVGSTDEWVRQVSTAVGATVPALAGADGDGRRRSDVTRRGNTGHLGHRAVVAPFSTRAGPGGPVAVPISWDELDDPDLAPDRFTVATIGERLRTVGDPLAPLVGQQQQLPPLT
ncbi:MAG: ATP-dependent DNA ligase [Acidimicrobiia bacterium]|nr:ATP-dependent DNA ligase [Acidimicrobiia bacterium]